ncbi:Proenkephalin-A [Myotis brandtii]|uniref:Proenkephalin-A n=1 Tax=Myotis brandtii TaxID=109478 RepID=S7PJT6_MYOBR|nr:Proenkephalin-A [Myotis brandtii]
MLYGSKSPDVGPGQLHFNQLPWDPFALLHLLKFCDDFNSSVENQACTLECEGKLPSLKTWDACKELLQLSTLEFPPEGTSALRESSRPEESHVLAKKYGGFMKRYGGFMKKTDELSPLEPEEEAEGGETLAKRYGGFMKKDAGEGGTLGNSLDPLKELLGTGDNRESSPLQEAGDEEK